MSCSEISYSVCDIVKDNDFTGLKLTFYDGVGDAKTIMDLTGYSFVIHFKKGKGSTTVFSFLSSDSTITIPTPTNGEIFLQPRKMSYLAGTYIADINLINAAGKLHTYTTINWTITQNV